MTIELSKRQFKKLLECVHIGTHVLTDNKHARKADISDEEDLERSIYRQALGADLDEDVEVDIDTPVPTDTFAKRVHKEMDEYENAAFWEILAEELGTKDMKASYSEAELKNMNDEEYDEILDTFSAFYHDEFSSHGITHLGVDHPLTVTEK